MSENLIFNFKDPRIQFGNYRSQVDEIFFESSTKKDFKDAQEKESFNWKYLGFYLAHYPEYAWLVVKENQVLGYIVGMPFTQDPSLYQIQPHLQNFETDFTHYPAHLHINCHKDSRGQGVGQMLIQRLFAQLKAEGVKGLHILTGPLSDNCRFYRKLGFDSEITRNSIHFMGISLK